MYTIKLTRKEYEVLPWFVYRGYFPEDVFEALDRMTDGDDEETWTVGTFTLAEHEAWPLAETYSDDNDEAFLTCMADPLRLKILDLCESIV